MFPVTTFVVEDIKACTWKNSKRWNSSFSPLEVGKQWFYSQLRQVGMLETRTGHETKELRDSLGLKKVKNKLAEKFETHNVDSFVLANWYVGGHEKPDNTDLLVVVPLRFHRRQLHRLEHAAGHIRSSYGGTMSLAFKRGSLVKHSKYGLVFIGGSSKGRISLHSVETGKRLCQNAKPQDIEFLSYNTWRTRLLLSINEEVSAA
jgi:hypothetical protein